MESYAVTKLTRKQIYDEVWSISISGMVKKYDISYSLLWKQIKDANIPIPPAGYWTKKEYGKETIVAELKGNPNEVVELYKRMSFISKNKDDTKIQSGEKTVINTPQSIIENEAKENDAASSNYSGEYDTMLPFLSAEEKEHLFVAVSNVKITYEKERLHSKIIAHRKRIESWEKEFKKQTPYQQKQSKNTAPYLKYDVADNSLPRVFRIIDSLIKAMKPLGVDLDDNLCFHYKTDYIQLRFSEATTEILHELTKEERMSLLKYEDERKRYSWASKPQIRKYDHIHNGRISVGVGLKRRFRDCKFTTLEEQLGDIMIAIFIAINDAKLAREEREEAERKRQEEQRKREELRKRYVVLGINMDGCKDILGIWIGEHESAKFWLNVLNDLKNRGVKTVYVFCVDGLSGFREAIASVYPEAQIQRCIIHQIRSSTRFVSYKDIKKLMADLKTVYQAINEDEASRNLARFKETWGKMYPSCVKSWEENWDILSTFFAYPAEVRRIIYTTNIIEGLNRQFRSITKSKPSFTNDDSLRKMLYLASKKIVEHWTVRCRNWDQVLNQLEILFSDQNAG